MKESADETLSVKGMHDSRSPAKRYLFAFVAVAVAFLIREALDPLLENSPVKHVFITFIVATTAVAWYSGLVPSILTFISGFILADYFFLDPKYSFSVQPHQYLDTMLPPILVCITIILFSRSMHVAREKANAHAHKAIENQKQLESEIAERKRVEDEVRRLNSELELRVEVRTSELVASNQELESFTYSVSHDLRAPLRHVDGYAQILEEEFGPQMSPEAQKFARKIRQGSQNMGRLVDDLLNLSRVGKKELTRQHVALGPLVEGVIADVKVEAGDRNIEWKISELPEVDCDPGLIRQVFTNLISNSIKYSRQREHTVIEVGAQKNNGDVAFFVRDNGVGFNMKYSGKLFGVFQRLHRVEEFEGTGVGLATVARIIRKHGGRIWADAELNKGAAFFFTLPAQGPAPSQWNSRLNDYLNRTAKV
ncbi:MAG TPA: ATP-binding protein [Verrucomicrobiae bacterium]|jgi:signal transduction histidine kinase|nr:ATP-binding protein [Verrucomicrobiae bacterium]